MTNSPSKQQLLVNLKQWQQKLSNFFSASMAKNSRHMKCGEGCSACCHVERTVFPIEAELIRQTYPRLSARQESAPGQCAFLLEGSCTIYDARPSICRSHGLALLTDSGVSHCELNFTEELPPKEDWLSQNTADTVLTTLQIAYEKAGYPHERVSLRLLWRELTGGDKTE
ncbi:MAG: hypothetical protein CME71_03370 [Halobacteriovorax sp.]|nr:hypothetical protein [Halobacteriovorax sp.]|tara:strand:+ start:424 stop:933 length:510 start_codon:yes stop_codon:yes gene_type:complete